MAAGVLVAHTLAYRLTGTATVPLHEYLDHLPQLLLVLAVVGLAGAGLAGRLGVPSAWPFPVVAVATFVVQEHVEQLVHTGGLPWIWGSPAFVVGILLQLPVALLAWALARLLLVALTEFSERRRALPRLLLDVLVPTTSDVRPLPAAPLPGRGPPFLRKR